MSNNPYEEINPSQVILDPEFAQTATSDDIINPAEVVLDPEFAQTAAAPAAAERSDREKIRQVFTSDPLAFISDPNQRRALEMSINASDNPDEVRQKIAVAAFYSNANSAQTGFIFDNFDRSMELAVGRAATPDAEYTKIAEVVRDQKFLPGDTQQYTERLQQNKDAGNAVIRSVVGMGKNIGVGIDTALLNFATFFKLLSGRPGSGRDAMGNYRATGWFGAQQSAAIDAAQPELAKIKAEEDLAKRAAFAKAYRVDELGIPALPLEPVWSSKPFGSAMDEENKQIWEHFYQQLKADKSFDFLPENVSTYAELEKLYTDEVKKRYAEKFGSADNADQEFDRAATRADWKAEAASKDIFNEIDYDQVWGKINQWSGYFRDQFNENADAYHPGDIDKDTLKMMVESGDYGQVIGKSLAMCFDQVALSIIPMLMTSNLAKPLGTLATPATTAAFGAQMYGQGAAEFAAAKAADVEAIKANVDSYAAMYSAAETIPEMLLGWIPLSKQILNMGKPTREVLKQKLVNGIWDYGKGFVKAGASDTMGEMITFGVEKILDAAYDVNLPGGKKWEDLTDAEKAEFMQDGALETVVVSMLTAGSGGIVGTTGKRQTIAEKNLRKERVRQVLDARINELAAKDVLTDEENAELQQLITFNDASDLDSAITAAQKIITRQALEPVNIIAETANPDIPLDVVENANNALIRNKISNAVFWDVNQTIRQAQELTRQFPGFALTVYNSHTDMPADLRQRVEAAGMTPSRVPAFIMPDSNDVILIANKVPPSQVAKAIGHEIIGHRGIRAVFGEDYDNLLDLVYRDHADEINALAGAYARNPKNNLENQRYLTEEYLANCANAKVKPSWWKEFIARIRAWLRERFPSLQFTQKDIEGVLSMAARRVRKNSVVKENLTTDGDMRFLADAENLVPVAALDGSASRSREFMDFIDRAVDGETDVDLYGEKLSDVFEDWESTDPASRREWLENYYEEEIRSTQADERLESDLAQKDAYRDAFDTIEEKISAALDEYDLTIDRAKTNAAGDSFYISFDDNEGESYTLRFSNHQQPVRGSYRTSNFAEASGIGGSRSVADVSVVLTNGAFDLTPAMEFIRKVAGVSDLSDGSDNSDGGDLRFLLSEYSEDQTSDIVAILRPFVGYYLAKDDADYQAHLKSLGIDVDVRDAHAFAVLAMRENMADQAARSAEKRKKSIEARNKARSEYLYNSIPLYREAIDFAGTEDFKIKPSEKFWPEEFSGSFISKEFIEYSKSKKKDKSKLYNASGINSNEFAESLARKWGRDALEVEQEIIDFFRDLKKRDLWKEYTDFRKNAVLENKEANRLAAEEFAAQEKFRIENEVIGILERKTTITEDFVQENRAVYNELYRQVMKAEPPREPRKHDVETLNAAVQNESFDSATFAAAYKAAREESTREYMAKLRELRDKVMENKADAIALQREAGNFVRKNLPRELQGNFIRKIVKLLDYSTTPNSKYPDGRRRFMFDELVKEVTVQANKLRKDTAIAEIHRLLDRNRTKRTSKNVPYSPMGARQGFLDRINIVSRMKPENIIQLKLFALENADAIQERLDQLMDWKNEDANDPENIERNNLENDLLLNDREISILENFGALELKTADAVENSLRMLKDFIFAGRNDFKATMDERAQRIREERESIRLEMTAGNLHVDHRNDLDMSLDKYKEFVLANLSDGQLMRNFSRIDDEVKFYKSAHGKLYRMIEKATLQENNFLRDAQNRLEEFYTAHGLTANKLGKFLRNLTTVQDTGIVLPVYGVKKPAQIQPKGSSTPKEEMIYYGDESHGRPKKRAFVELEHTRKILEDIQDGVNISGILQLGGLQNTIDLRNELKQAGLKTGRYFTVAVTDNGYRIYTDTDSKDVAVFDLNQNNININRLLPTIADILANNQDSVFPLDEFALESAKNKILEYDGGMAARHSFDYGDDIDNAALEAYFNSEENSLLKSRKIEISTVSQHATQRNKVLKISPEVAVQIILTAEQENYKTNMKFNGFTDDKINELKAWVDKTLPGALELGYTVRQIVKDQRQELNKAVANRYGVALPDMPNFWYANFGGGVKDTVQDAGYGNPIGGLTVSANFLTARRYHTLPVDTQVGFMSLFMRKQLETAHFIAWSEPVRELRSIYSDLEVQNNLIKEFGHEAWQLWKKRIELLATGGDPGNVFSQFFNSMNQTFYPANIMLNVKSIVTQLAGGVSYSLYMPVGEMTKRLAIGRDTHEYHHFMAMVKASGYLENRALGGLDPSLKSFLMPFAKRKNISPAANKLMKDALAGNTWADRNGALYWGYMCYDYFRKLGLKRKMSAQDARKFAFDMWMRATDETQQSGEMKDLNSFNMNPGILRAITAYMTSPMQQFGLELSSIMRYMKNKSPEAKQEMIRRIVVNHIVNTTVMNLLASAFRHGLNFGDYLDDWEDYVFGWFFGSLDSVAVVGKILKNLFTGQSFGSNVQLFPIADNIARDVQKISADIQGKSEVQLLDYLQASGDLLMSAGPAMTRMIGAGLYISARETKRIMRWFEDEKLGK